MLKPSICVLLGFVASGLTALYSGAQSPSYWIVTAIMIVWLVALTRQFEGPSLGAEALGRVTIGTLVRVMLQRVAIQARGSIEDPATATKGRDLLDTLPLYIAGMGVGVVPVNDWFTAQVDGQEVVILEHVKESDAAQQ